MTLTKEMIAKAVAERNGFNNKKLSEIVESLLETIKKSLESGKDVLVSGFGKFSVRQKAAPYGRDPSTGVDLISSPKRFVTFSCSGKLKERGL